MKSLTGLVSLAALPAVRAQIEDESERDGVIVMTVTLVAISVATMITIGAGTLLGRQALVSYFEL